MNLIDYFKYKRNLIGAVESFPVKSLPLRALEARLLTGKAFGRKTLNRKRILVIFGFKVSLS
jgi:hypothetical protein